VVSTHTVSPLIDTTMSMQSSPEHTPIFEGDVSPGYHDLIQPIVEEWSYH
jgi:hypothetical protein